MQGSHEADKDAVQLPLGEQLFSDRGSECAPFLELLRPTVPVDIEIGDILYWQDNIL